MFAQLRTVKEKVLRYVPVRLRNRYGAILGFFLLWVTVLADYDIIAMFKLRSELRDMRKQHAQYVEDVERTREQLYQLNSDQALLEKFAREKYLMKRDNEDVFVLVPKKK